MCYNSCVASRNLKEVEGKSFAQVKNEAKALWNEALGRIQVGGGSTDQYRTFYSCLYRSLLFPRKFYEFDAAGKPVHYSPYVRGYARFGFHRASCL